MDVPQGRNWHIFSWIELLDLTRMHTYQHDFIAIPEKLDPGRMVWALGLWTRRRLDYGRLDNRLTFNNYAFATKEIL